MAEEAFQHVVKLLANMEQQQVEIHLAQQRQKKVMELLVSQTKNFVADKPELQTLVERLSNSFTNVRECSLELQSDIANLKTAAFKLL